MILHGVFYFENTLCRFCVWLKQTSICSVLLDTYSPQSRETLLNHVTNIVYHVDRDTAAPGVIFHFPQILQTHLSHGILACTTPLIGTSFYGFWTSNYQQKNMSIHQNTGISFCKARVKILHWLSSTSWTPETHTTYTNRQLALFRFLHKLLHRAFMRILFIG